MKKLLMLLMLFTVFFAMSCADRPVDPIEPPPPPPPDIPLTPLVPSVNINEGLDKLWAADNTLSQYFEKSEVAIDSAESLLNALKLETPQQTWLTKKDDDTIPAYEGASADEVKYRAHPSMNAEQVPFAVDVIGDKENISFFHGSKEKNAEVGKEKQGNIQFSVVFVKDNGYGKIVSGFKFEKFTGEGFKDIPLDLTNRFNKRGKEIFG